MSSNKFKEFLESRNVKYVSIAHSRAYTAQEIAASAHIKGQELAKPVIVKLDGKIVMCVLPASHVIDFSLLKDAMNAREAVLLKEEEYKEKFIECETGAEPPFGNLYNMDVIVSKALADDKEITFNACSFSELIRISFDDYISLVNPLIKEFSKQAYPKKAA